MRGRRRRYVRPLLRAPSARVDPRFSPPLRLLPQDCSSQRCLQPSKIHVLVLVLHGGNILDTGSGTAAPLDQPPAHKRRRFFCPAGEQNSKQGDENTLNGVFETVMRVHYPAALGRIAVRTVPCPAVCVDAFSLVSK